MSNSVCLTPRILTSYLGVILDLALLESSNFAHLYKMYSYICGHYPTARRVGVSNLWFLERAKLLANLRKHLVDLDELHMQEHSTVAVNAAVLESVTAANIKPYILFTAAPANWALELCPKHVYCVTGHSIHKL